MDRSAEADDAFLDLVRRQLQRPELSMEEALRQPLATTLYEMMARAREEPSKSPSMPMETPLSLASLARSRAMIEAAIADTFELSALSPNDAERQALIAAADVVMLEGKRRLRLTDSARAELLEAARNTDLYQQILRDSVANDKAQQQSGTVSTDLIRRPTVWLQRFLANQFPDLNLATPRELSAALAARQRLRLAKGLSPKIPSIVDLECRVELAELLEPLRILIGAGATPRTDRFVGREKQLAELRVFVDELSPQSISEALRRWSGAAAHALGVSERPNLKIIQADGGLGKSALLAKFVLDHVQAHSFPFAYLDFDRAVLDPEQPPQLLCEIARQVGLQFPAAQTELAALIRDVSRQRIPSASADAPLATLIRDPFASFVETLRKYATHGGRAFLLILDTLEVVQWNPNAVSGLAFLLAEFRAKGLVELRTVVSGRADVPELRRVSGLSEPGRNMQLRALSLDEATRMAERLGQAAIGDAWNSSWSRTLAGDVPNVGVFEVVKQLFGTSKEVRREPLTIRVAVDLVVQAAPDKRQNVVDEIGSLADDGQHSLAARLYERRIVNHVRDPRARKLAWPGLVLRRVTLDIVRNLLASLCGLDATEVEGAFQSLEKEVWMVTREGDALKHRPDLRARTLPLMKANDPEKFERVARAAVAYFGGRRHDSTENGAEWIYHRLQAGEAIRDVVDDITPEILQKLAGAAEDFAQDSDVASFIASRTSKTRLYPNRIRQMAPNDALYHLRATSRTVFELNDTSIDAIALELATRLDRGLVGIPRELSASARALWIKTGYWDRMRMPEGARCEELVNPAWRTEIYWASRLAPSLSESRQAVLLRCYLPALTGELKGADRPGLRATVHGMVLARICESELFRELDQQCVRLMGSSQPNASPSRQAALRTAIVFGDRCRGAALELWLRSRRRGAVSRVQAPTFSASELRALADVQPDIKWGIDLQQQTAARVADEQIVTSASSVLEQFLAAAPDGISESAVGRSLARVFACRDEDWIVPLAYAAHRVGYRRQVLEKRLSGYQEWPRAQAQGGPPSWSGMVGAMRLADEAGELASFAQFVLAGVEGVPVNASEARSLSELLDRHRRWREAILHVIDEPEGSAVAESSAISRSTEPPPPGPIRDKDDPQRGRWGGRSTRDGRSLRATLESVEGDLFFFSLVVESTDGSPLQPPIVFHLHDSYPRSTIHIRRIADGKRAELTDWNATGVFTAGAQVLDRSGSWRSLELDLATLPGLPKRFLTR